MLTTHDQNQNSDLDKLESPGSIWSSCEKMSTMPTMWLICGLSTRTQQGPLIGMFSKLSIVVYLLSGN